MSTSCRSCVRPASGVTSWRAGKSAAAILTTQHLPPAPRLLAGREDGDVVTLRASDVISIRHDTSRHVTAAHAETRSMCHTRHYFALHTTLVFFLFFRHDGLYPLVEPRHPRPDQDPTLTFTNTTSSRTSLHFTSLHFTSHHRLSLGYQHAGHAPQARPPQGWRMASSEGR